MRVLYILWDSQTDAIQGNTHHINFLALLIKNKIELRQIRARLLLHSPGFPAGWEFRERTEAAG